MILKCQHCGEVSRDEFMACELPDCSVEKVGNASVSANSGIAGTMSSAPKDGLLESQTIDQAKAALQRQFYESALYGGRSLSTEDRLIDALIAAVRRSGEPT